MGYLRKEEILSVLLQLVPPGAVTTYGSLARVLGTSPRALGGMLRRNRSPIVVPCHRVVESSGGVGGYTIGGRESREFKLRLLKLEGVEVRGGRVERRCFVELDEFLLGFRARHRYAWDSCPALGPHRPRQRRASQSLSPFEGSPQLPTS